MPLVGVVIGSRSDEAVIQDTVKALDEMGISQELSVISAHRSPERAREYAKAAVGRGLEVLIGAAGGSAALPGVLASWTTLPVIGVPLASSELKGIDALHAIAQMPPGVPVACMALGFWGARNAAYMAAAILSLSHPEIRVSYGAYRERLSAG